MKNYIRIPGMPIHIMFDKIRIDKQTGAYDIFNDDIFTMSIDRRYGQWMRYYENTTFGIKCQMIVVELADQLLGF